MRHVFALAALALACHPGRAAEPRQYDRQSPKSYDQFIVGIECNTREQHLEIGLFDSDNIPDKRMDLWDTWDLKKNKPGGDAVDKVLTVARGCTLGGHRYRIELTGQPANWNMNGPAGSLPVRRKGETLAELLR
ncbi:hypothetical protein SRABI118_03258 [Massilia sp. Bi118]|uniref:hypothetical protein n=1 Tax=Massilia sp. Bi118 TaxID=2822346 RepID=UPI001D499A93|nr:hypothetical protein [Massilia sp. Bi118]CAH0262437.1 hypothetical protein SRABI118_03258 [Massilia sp. Bi118]